MNDERLERLLWERIDGTISEQDLAELEDHLAGQPHELERKVAKLAEMLGEKDVHSPPAELRGKIDGALAAAKPPRSAGSAARPNVRTLTTPAWMTRWLPVAASLLIGVAIGYMMGTGPTGTVDPSRVSGVMTTPAFVPGPAFQIDLGGGDGLITVDRGEDRVNLEIDLAPGTDLSIELETADGRRVNLDASGPGPHRLAIAGDAVPANLVIRKDGEIVTKQRIEGPPMEDQP